MPQRTGNAAPAAGQRPVLRVGPEGAWFAPPAGQRVDLSQSPVLARLLARLVEHQQRHAGASLSTEALAARVWPDVALQKSAATNRLYVAVAKLRKLGLDGILIRSGGGYQLLKTLHCVVDREDWQ